MRRPRLIFSITQAHGSGTVSGHSHTTLGARPIARASFAWLPKREIASVFRMAVILCGIPNKKQALRERSNFRHTDFGKPHNSGMKKIEIRQVLARNLQAEIDRHPVIENQRALALRSGVSPSHLSEIMRGMCSVTVDLVNDMAYALGIQPWVLLADSEETKRAALSKMMFGHAVADAEVEKYLPFPPKSAPHKEGAPKRKKPGRNESRPRGEE